MKSIFICLLFVFSAHFYSYSDSRNNEFFKDIEQLKKENIELKAKIAEVQNYNLGKFDGINLASNLIIVLIATLFAVNIYSSFHKSKQIATEISSSIASSKTDEVLKTYKADLEQSKVLQNTSTELKNQILQTQASIDLQLTILRSLMNDLNQEEDATIQ